MPIVQPSPNAIELNTAPVDDVAAPVQDDEQVESVRSELTGLILVAGIRFDGSTIVRPWNKPEGEIFDWMTSVDISLVDGVFSGLNGVFAASAADGSDSRSLVVRFGNLGKSSILSSWGTEFLFFGELDVVARELAAYEVVKAFGCEDICPPLCIRDIDTSSFLTDSARQRMAKALKISPTTVDEAVGTSAIVQLAPFDFDNFAEQWAIIGSSNKERWSRATDQLRYSIYRAYLIDFILGVPVRSIAGFLYNKNTDRIAMSDLGISMPHAGFSAEKYSQMRLKGWGRSSGGAARFVDNTPPSAYDFFSIFEDIDDTFLYECLMTATQFVDRMRDGVADRLAATLLEYDVPIQCVASLLLRVSYLAFAPGSVIKRPVEFLRNFAVPARAGTIEADSRIQSAIEYVNEIMTVATGEEFDCMLLLQEPLPDLVEMLV